MKGPSLPVLAATTAALLSCGRTEPLWPPVVSPATDGGACLAPTDCDDDVACTADACLSDGRCEHVPDDSVCRGNWCALNARCDPTRGCVSTPRNCDDGIPCHLSGCDVDAGACIYQFSDALCSPGTHCGATGCVACLVDSDCDDGVACTLDTCGADGRCRHLPEDGACDAGWCDGDPYCDPTVGCQIHARDCDSGVACVATWCDDVHRLCVRDPKDSLCPDAGWCAGDVYCDVQLGCQLQPRDCDSGIVCDVATCDEATRSCVQTPVDSLCQDGLLCGPNGCAMLAYASTSNFLYDVELPSGALYPIGATSPSLADVALSPNSILYGCGAQGMVLVDRRNAAQTVIWSVGALWNALDAAPDGGLYGAAANDVNVYVVDVLSRTSTPVAQFPSGLTSSGDIAFIDGTMYASAKDNTPVDSLIVFDLDAGTSSVVGSIGYGCVWGLAAYGLHLYGFTCSGEIISIDVSTGAGSPLASTGTGFWGASSR
jgi:hypothetical protein